MATYTNIDIQRMFDTPANLASNLINGQFGYDITNDRLAVKRLADGVMKYFDNDTDSSYLKTDGTTPLTGDWDAGEYDITGVGNLVVTGNITTSDFEADGYSTIEDLTVVTMNVTGDTSVVDLAASGDITVTGNVYTGVKSGATQGGAGAVSGEVWKTSSHATLPDNVLMIGV